MQLPKYHLFTVQTISYPQLKSSVAYNKVMLEIYQKRFAEVRYGWQFARSYFVFKKMKHYEAALQTAILNNLLNEINHGQHVSIVTQ